MRKPVGDVNIYSRYFCDLNARTFFNCPSWAYHKEPMTTPTFDEDGYLADKTHQFTKSEFIDAFCSPATLITREVKSKDRQQFSTPFESLYSWANEAGATSIIVGGSFITNKPSPKDIDVLVIFSRKEDISTPNRSFGNERAIVDIQCLSEDEPELLQGYMQLLGADKRYIGRGLVQIKFHTKVASHDRSEQQSKMLAAAMASYVHRHRPTRSTRERLVIPIHGIRSDGNWIPKFTFLASSAGWVVAPFVYGFESGMILGNDSRKAEVVEEFRLWIDEIRKTFKGSISVVAHSFGTYVVGKYLTTAGSLIEPFAGIVLAGSILTTDFDWHKFLEKQAVNMVMNTRSENDEWVRMLPEGGIKYLASDPLMGKAAVEGFKNAHARLTERKSNLLSHTNMFESDVIVRLWLPFLALAEKQVPIGEWTWADDEVS